MDSSRLLHTYTCLGLALSPGHSQILSRSRGEKSGEGLGSLLTAWAGNGGLS